MTRVIDYRKLPHPAFSNYESIPASSLLFSLHDHSLLTATCSMPSVGAALWRSLRAHQVYGANTEVGKTLVSTVLCNAVRRLPSPGKAAFLKPVSTGPLNDADDRYDILDECLIGIEEN